MRFVNDLIFAWLPILEQQPWIVRSLFCSLFVIAATWLIALAAKRQSAAIRHRIFSLGFLSLLLVPAVIVITAGWNPTISMTRAAPRTIAASSDTAARTSTDFVQPVEIGPDAQTAFRSNAVKNPESMFVESNDEPTPQTSVQDSSTAIAPVTTAVKEANPSSTSAMNLPGMPVVLGILWMTGVLLLTMRLVLEWLLTCRVVHSGVAVTDPKTLSLLREAMQSAQRFKMQRSTRLPNLLCSSSTPVPIATGIFAPTIILPAGFGKWSNDRLRHVLLHELAHIDRHDLLTNLLARIACLLHWFNPLVWLAARRMNLERELACDDFLICLGASPECYATDLFEIAAAVQSRLRMAQLATPMATRTNLKLRIERLTNLNLDRRLMSTRMTIVTTSAAVMTLIGLAILSPSFGVAQDRSTKKVPDLNDVAVTLSGELPADWIDQLKAMPKLQKLTIRNPAVKNLNVARLRELSNLAEFSAEDFSIETGLADIVAINVAQLPKLKSLQFHRTGLTRRGMEALKQSPATELILDGEELITDADYKHVAAMRSLTSLVIDSTSIEAAGLRTLQTVPGLNRLALRRHPAGTIEHDSDSRIKAIAGLKHLTDLEICDTGFNRLVGLKTCATLRRLKLTRCGGFDAAQSLKQLVQLKRIELDETDFHKQSFPIVKSALAEIGVELVDVSRMTSELLKPDSNDPDSATQIARRALAAFDFGQQFPSFWISWHQQWGKIPSMTAEPTRTIHRLKRAITADREVQPWKQDVTYSYAPGQFLMRNLSFENTTPGWQQTTFGDGQYACSREGRPGDAFSYFLRNGVKEFEESMGHQFPRQLYITHQHFWWGVSTHHNVTSSSIEPERVAYTELPAETLAGEPCRVFEAPGRSERLWVSQSTGRLRGLLHYIHQGYFTPFYQQAIVTKLVGRRVQSQEEYNNLTKGPKAISKEVANQLSQAWAEHEFPHGYPSDLIVLDDYREIAPGKWFPFKVKSAGWHHNPENQGKYDYIISESDVSEVFVDRSDLEPFWDEFTPKEGDKIQDQRNAVAVDYKLNKDRTEAELKKLIYDQMLKYARSTVLLEIAQSPFTKLVGKPAPQLAEGTWIGDRPDLKGKRYLIHFWATWCGPCKNDVPLLNKLAQNRIVIGIHPGDTSIDQIGESIKESKMAYPTVVAPQGANDVLGYPAKIYPYYVEVDEQGNVARQGFLEDVLEIKVRNSIAPDRPSNLNGSILGFDEKQELVVLSIGEPEGLEANQLLQVVRDDKSTVQLRVVATYKNLSVARLTDPTQGAFLNVGDKVRD